MPNAVTAQVLRAIAPRFSGAIAQRQSQIIEAIARDFTPVCDEYEINTDLRVAHFLAQIVHESAGLRTTEEFASGAAYEGRRDLGNTIPGDGVRYKGRGVLQLTGRANYRHYGQILGLDLEGQPQMAAEPGVSLRIACVYWRDRHINPLCDADDLEGVTRKVNGGLNGLADRRQYLIKAKQALAANAVASNGVTEHFTIPAADGPGPLPVEVVNSSPMTSIAGLASSAAALNDLASQGSRIAELLKKVKGWIWRSKTTVVVGGGGLGALSAVTPTPPDPSTDPAGGILIMALQNHPMLAFGLLVAVLILLIGLYAIVKRIEKWLLTAWADGRYQPR